MPPQSGSHIPCHVAERGVRKRPINERCLHRLGERIGKIEPTGSHFCHCFGFGFDVRERESLKPWSSEQLNNAFRQCCGKLWLGRDGFACALNLAPPASAFRASGEKGFAVGAFEPQGAKQMDTITSHFNLTAKSTTELKGLYCRLFNRLCAPYLAAYEKEQIHTAINQVTAELQFRCVL